MNERNNCEKKNRQKSICPLKYSRENSKIARYKTRGSASRLLFNLRPVLFLPHNNYCCRNLCFFFDNIFFLIVLESTYYEESNVLFEYVYASTLEAQR